jgi:hypothetical protein
LGQSGNEHKVYLSYYGETEDEFHARYPELARPSVPDVEPSFDDPQHLLDRR